MNATRRATLVSLAMLSFTASMHYGEATVEKGQSGPLQGSKWSVELFTVEYSVLLLVGIPVMKIRERAEYRVSLRSAELSERVVSWAPRATPLVRRDPKWDCADFRLLAVARAGRRVDSIAFGWDYMEIGGKCYELDTALLRELSTHLPVDHATSIDYFLRAEYPDCYRRRHGP